MTDEDNILNSRINILGLALILVLLLVVGLHTIQGWVIRDLQIEVDMLKEIVDELCIRGNLDACGDIVEEYKGIDINN